MPASTTTTTMAPPPCESEVFQMTISSYNSEAKNMANGSYIKSVPIDAGGHSWRIVLYPNGKLADTAGFMSLFLLLDDVADADEDVHVEFSLMMGGAGRGALFLNYGIVAATFSRSDNSHGFSRFLSHDEFQSFVKSFVKSDRFAIRCEITVFPSLSGQQPDPTVVKPPPSPPKLLPAREAPPSSSTSPAPPVSPPVTSVGRAPPSGLSADLGRLLVTKEGADVELEVRGKVFAAHKSVLAARSPVFKEEFFGPSKEKDTSYVVISNILPEAFEALLHYMYTDSLPEMILMTMNSAKDESMLAEDLLIAADRYNLKDLKSVTENKLCSHVGVSKVLWLLALAEQYGCVKLKKTCLRFVASGDNARAIMATGDVENLARSSPSVVNDVITEMLDAREAGRRRRSKVCIWALIAFCFLVFLWPFVVFGIIKMLKSGTMY